MRLTATGPTYHAPKAGAIGTPSSTCCRTTHTHQVVKTLDPRVLRHGVKTMAEIQEAGWARLSNSKKALNLETDDGKRYTIAFERIEKLKTEKIKGARFSTFIPSEKEKS